MCYSSVSFTGLSHIFQPIMKAQEPEVLIILWGTPTETAAHSRKGWDSLKQFHIFITAVLS